MGEWQPRIIVPSGLHLEIFSIEFYWNVIEERSFPELSTVIIIIVFIIIFEAKGAFCELIRRSCVFRLNQQNTLTENVLSMAKLCAYFMRLPPSINLIFIEILHLHLASPKICFSSILSCNWFFRWSSRSLPTIIRVSLSISSTLATFTCDSCECSSAG